MVNVVCTAPVPSTVRVCRTTDSQRRLTVEPGTQPGPESMVTTVPTGPELGASVIVAVKVSVTVIDRPDVEPTPVSRWLPHVDGMVTVGVREPFVPVTKLC